MVVDGGDVEQAADRRVVKAHNGQIFRDAQPVPAGLDDKAGSDVVACNNQHLGPVLHLQQ
ncbi:hypothetical protein D3C73_1648380 [compost metagenome]